MPQNCSITAESVSGMLSGVGTVIQRPGSSRIGDIPAGSHLNQDGHLVHVPYPDRQRVSIPWLSLYLFIISPSSRVIR